MISKPIIIELTEIKQTQVFPDDILKPKVAKAKRLSEKQIKIMSAYQRFKEKHVV